MAGSRGIARAPHLKQSNQHLPSVSLPSYLNTSKRFFFLPGVSMARRMMNRQHNMASIVPVDLGSISDDDGRNVPPMMSKKAATIDSHYLLRLSFIAFYKSRVSADDDHIIP